MTTLTRRVSSRRGVIVDTDAGVDDAQALALLFNNSSEAEILGVICCHGNTTLDNVVGNVCATMEMWSVDTEIPVYIGAAGPLLGNRIVAEEWFVTTTP